MSAYSIGTTTFMVERARSHTRKAATEAGVDAATKDRVVDVVAPTRADGLAVIIKWVPGEVIGAYAAVITALQPNKKGEALIGTSSAWLLASCVGAFLLTVLGAIIEFRRVKVMGKMPNLKRVEVSVRALLAVLGLLIWSYIIPGSATNQSHFALANAAAIPVVVPFIAVVFGLFAETAVLPASLALIRRILA